MSSLLYSLGHWTVRARRLVVILWIALLVGLGILAGALGRGLDSTITIPGTESQTALDSLSHTFPEVSGASAQLLVVAPDGETIEDPAYRSAIGDAVTELGSIDGVKVVSSPYSADVTGAISDDDRAAIITVQLTQSAAAVSDATKSALQDEATKLRDALPQAESVTIGGQLFAIELPAVSLVEVLGVVIALGILILTFGSLLAAGMPILIAVVGLAASLSIAFLSTAFTDVNTTAPVLALMLGLAVGIDYSLFIISRHREQLRSGMDPGESIARAIATSGSAVVFAGLTVIIALLGLSVAGIPFLSGVGVFTAIGIAMAVVASLTLLPALLGFAGARLAPRARRVRRRARGAAGADLAVPASREHGRFYRRWVQGVTKHPIVTIVAIVLVVGSAIIPASQLRLALTDGGGLPEDTEARQTYDLISDHFGPGYNATLIATGTIITSNDPVGLMDDLAAEIRSIPGVKAVPLATPNEDGDTGIVQIIPEGGPSDPSTEQLVRTLRSMHDHFEEAYGVDLKVTGFTAVAIDVSAKLGSALLPFGILVVGLSLILLMIVFRSIWVPIKATLGYLLSVGAAFGMVQLAYSTPWLSAALNVPKEGPVISFMPIIVMGVLFGLAMDYELFLVARIREEHAHGRSARAAIEAGFVGSAPVVTAAGLIMFAVFASFVPEGNTTVKPMAIGLATGVLVDAFVVRMTLVPAVLRLLDEHAWWMPKWLDRILPHLDVEGEGLARELERREAAGRGELVPAASGAAARRARLARGWGLAALVLVPTALLGTTLWALWPAQPAMAETTAAIVNDDDPVTIDGHTVPLGRQLAAKLVGDEVADETGANFRWVLTDADDAAAGLADRRYAAVVTIPEGFSAAATSLSGDDAGNSAERATIQVDTENGSNSLNDALAATVTRAAADLAGQDVAASYLDNVYLGFNAIHDRLADAHDGASQLAVGATALADGTAKAESGANDLAAGADQVANGASALAGSAADLAAGASAAASGAELTAGGAKQLASAAQQAASGATALQAGATMVADGVATLQQQLTSQATAIAQLAAACPTSGAASGYCDELAALAAAATDPAAAQQLQELVVGSAEVSDGVTSLAGATGRLADAAGQIADGAAQVSDGAAQVSSGAGALAGGAGQLASGAASSASGADSLADAITQLNAGADGVRNGATQLDSGLDQAVQQVPTYSEGERSRLSEVAAEPITADGASLAAAAADGPWPTLAASPLFWIALAIWLLALVAAIAVARRRRGA